MEHPVHYWTTGGDVYPCCGPPVHVGDAITSSPGDVTCPVMAARPEPGSLEWHEMVAAHKAAGWRCGRGLAQGYCDDPEHARTGAHPTGIDPLAAVVAAIRTAAAGDGGHIRIHALGEPGPREIVEVVGSPEALAQVMLAVDIPTDAIHKPYEEDGVTWCGYTRPGGSVVNGCGRPWPCPTVIDRACAAAEAVAAERAARAGAQ